MIDLTIPTTLTWIGSMIYCVYNIKKARLEHKRLGLRVLATLIFSESVILYDILHHISSRTKIVKIYIKQCTLVEYD